MQLDTGCSDIETMLNAERPRLVRLCARLAGSSEAAEDLAQETLIEAWRHLHKLHDPAGYSAWLSAIARNVCHRWTHARRDENRSNSLAHGQDFNISLLGDDEPADPYDFVTELEHGELADLLDQALRLLPADTRAVLIKRYFDASPHAEIAAALGLSEGAVKVKVHRGKLALRRVLTTDLRVASASFGIIDPQGSRVQETELWCPVCGKHRLEAHFTQEVDAADLRCPVCCIDQHVFIYSSLPASALHDTSTLQTSLGEKTQIVAGHFRALASGVQILCPCCGRPASLRESTVHPALATYQDVCLLYSSCTFCQSSCSISWRMLAQSHPQVWQFWQRHSRMYTLPPKQLEIDGAQAVVTGFRSTNNRAGLDVVTLRGNLNVLGVYPVSN